MIEYSDGSGLIICADGATVPTYITFPQERPVGGDQQTPMNIDDINVTVYENADIINEWILSPSIGSDIVAVNPDIATIDSSGYVSMVSEGIGNFLIISQNWTISIPLEMSITDGGEYTEFNYWLPGTFGAITLSAMEGFIFQKDPNTSTSVFSAYSPSTLTYRRNANAWASGLTPLSPWNSRGGAFRAGVAITPRHIIMAAHYPLFVGDVVHFVTEDNQTIVRSITAIQNHPNYSTNTSYDIRIGLLDSDLPSDISPMKVIGPDILEVVPSVKYGVPALLVNHEEKLNYIKVITFDSISTGGGRPLSSDPGYPYYSSIGGGSSGSPMLMWVDGGWCIITVLRTAGGGFNFSQYNTDINNLISSVDASASIITNYQISVPSLSSYIHY